MAFKAEYLSKMTKEKLFEVLGAPSVGNVARVDGQPLADGIPHYLVGSATWDGWVSECDEDFRLLDFGECFVLGREPEIITQPGGLMPPETVLTEGYDYRVDLWRVGIVVRFTVPIILREPCSHVGGRSTRSCLEDSHSIASGTETTLLSR